MNTQEKLIEDHAKCFFILSWKDIEGLDVVSAQHLDGSYNSDKGLGLMNGLLIKKLNELGYIEIVQDPIAIPLVVVTKEGHDFLAR